MTVKIILYAIIMLILATILAVLFIRDKRRQKGGK